MPRLVLSHVGGARRAPIAEHTDFADTAEVDFCF
jgi:hypothetical protein